MLSHREFASISCPGGPSPLGDGRSSCQAPEPQQPLWGPPVSTPGVCELGEVRMPLPLPLRPAKGDPELVSVSRRDRVGDVGQRLSSP